MVAHPSIGPEFPVTTGTSLTGRSIAQELKRELAYEGWILIEIAKTNPFRSNDEIRNTRPTQVSVTFRPGIEVYLLEMGQCVSAKLSARSSY